MARLDTEVSKYLFLLTCFDGPACLSLTDFIDGDLTFMAPALW